ncbi:hypothetical protein H0H93_008073 [Arthromyces matolae]|nr:hypothetical protein H0H93_008073 [Arthromyces matolae]
MADAEAKLVALAELNAPFIIGVGSIVSLYLLISVPQSLRRIRILDTFHSAMVADIIHYWYLTCRQPENYLGLLQFHWCVPPSPILRLRALILDHRSLGSTLSLLQLSNVEQMVYWFGLAGDSFPPDQFSDFVRCPFVLVYAAL